MSVGQMSVGQMSVGQMSVGQMSVGQMSVGQMSVGQMSVGQMSVANCLLVKCLLTKCLLITCPAGLDGYGILNKDPTVWLDGACNACIFPSFLGNIPTQLCSQGILKGEASLYH